MIIERKIFINMSEAYDNPETNEYGKAWRAEILELKITGTTWQALILRNNKIEYIYQPFERDYTIEIVDKC